MGQGFGVEKENRPLFRGHASVLGRDLGLENVVSGDSVFSLGAESRLQNPGAAAISLIDDLTDKASKDCPVAAALTGEAAANQTGDREGGEVLSAVIASVSEAIQENIARCSVPRIASSLRSSQWRRPSRGREARRGDPGIVRMAEPLCRR
jgi:hypothetical protein